MATDKPTGRARWCPSCAQVRRTYLTGEGSSAPEGSECCCHCQRVLEMPKNGVSHG